MWQTSGMDYGAKFGLAKRPKKLESIAVKRIIERGLWEQGIRKPLAEGTKRREWKAEIMDFKSTSKQWPNRLCFHYMLRYC